MRREGGGKLLGFFLGNEKSVLAVHIYDYVFSFLFIKHVINLKLILIDYYSIIINIKLQLFTCFKIFNKNLYYE